MSAVTSRPDPSEAVSGEPDHHAAPRSRRVLLTGLLGGLAGAALTALGRPPASRAAAGDPLILGQNNTSGATTTLTANTTGSAALDFVQNGPGIGLRGFADNGHGGLFRTARSDRFGFIAANDAGSAGTGGAISAVGKQSPGLRASSDFVAVDATGGTRGVSGQSSSTSGIGVFGQASATSGFTYGVWGRSSSTGGLGVFGDAIAESGSNHGVWGQSSSTNGRGVLGLAVAGIGTNYGVLGATNSPDGYGVYSSGRAHVAGNLSVSGTLSKGGGSFKIDHPLDAANKYLLHSFVESPDMLNIYTGNVTTGGNGEATVELPAWFGVLNADFRYQLTTIGSPARAWVGAKVKDNRFSITTDEPNVEVSWQLTGIRQDAWAKANRIPIELDKPADERGLYLHPEVHGQPAAKGIDARHRVPSDVPNDAPAP
jgi:hypothetical protein